MQTKFSAGPIARPLALLFAFFLLSGASVLAQNPPADPYNGTFDPQYNTQMQWVPAWDTGTYDRNHVLVGTVADFKPYRLLLAHPNDPASGGERTTMVDLKNGTAILPEGTNLSPGEHVAVFGYWSKGTFIANRVILRS